MLLRSIRTLSQAISRVDYSVGSFPLFIYQYPTFGDGYAAAVNNIHYIANVNRDDGNSREKHPRRGLATGFVFHFSLHLMPLSHLISLTGKRLPQARCWALALGGAALVLAGCESRNSDKNIKQTQPTAASPADKNVVKPEFQPVGDVARGKDVFRFQTFGNERFWAKAMRWQQGVIDNKLTPKQLLEMGLSIDMEALPPALWQRLKPEFDTDLSASQAPALHDPATTIALLNANAVIGVVPKDSNGDGRIDIRTGDMVGVSCAICHTITDKSAVNFKFGGSAGKRIDGPAPLTLNMGRFLALANNSRAYYPNLQQTFLGVSIGKAPRGLGPKSTEAEVDAYLRNPAYYPVGTFDETQDGIGNPVKNMPLFRQDLAAPYGTAGDFAQFSVISNSSYTMNLDMTNLATPEGREFLRQRGGPAGIQIHNEYKQILAETGVKDYPYLDVKMVGKPGEAANLVGRQVDQQQLRDLMAYVSALQAPRGARVDAQVALRGRALFQAKCTSCHNVDQSQPVPASLVDLKTLWPAYAPLPVGLRGNKKLSAILNSLGDFDNKMVIVDASDRGLPRGNALPLLLDLDRTTLFLHDASVKSLNALLDPQRGPRAPHPFYVMDATKRAELVDFLRSLDTETPKPAGKKTVAAR